jgi:2-polyprenyl-6-methoxyphenol hydroxylase-like FAD-dependent oxidoreductase
VTDRDATAGSGGRVVPVLIVGAGPVGLALANELGYRGIECVVVEKSDGTILFPAGEHIFSRTMEHLRRWGIADEARDLGWPPREYPGGVVFVTRVAGHVLARFDRTTMAGPSPFATTTPEPPLLQAKFRFDPLLRRRAGERSSVSFRYETEVIGIDDAAASPVVVTVRDVNRDRIDTIRARHVVACDGGRSGLRSRLGVSLQGSFAQGRNYAIYFRAPALPALLEEHGIAHASQIQTVSSTRRPYLTTVDGGERWRCSVYVSDDEPEPDARAVIAEAIGVDLDPEIIRAQPWSGHNVVADRYRVGNVYLCGDAAHLRWPKGGFGANTGVGDAVDLGWKLAAVEQGWGGDRLLASYEVERRPIAERNGTFAEANWQADRLVPSGPQLDEVGDDADAARRQAGDTIREVRRKEYATVGVQLGYRYTGSPICVDDGDPAPPDSPERYTPTSHVGCRAPHAWLADGSSTLDHYGPGFTIVSWRASDVQPLLAAMRARDVPAAQLELTDEAAGGLYGRALVLVRPDGHVAWRGDALPADVDRLVDTVRGAAVEAVAAD